MGEQCFPHLAKHVDSMAFSDGALLEDEHPRAGKLHDEHRLSVAGFS